MLLFVPRKSRGFNLLEVLLAGILFAIVIGGVAMGWLYHEKSLEKYRNRNMARLMLQQEMEKVLAGSYFELENRVTCKDPATNGHTPIQQALTRSIDSVNTEQDFTIESDVQENASKTLKTITVKVTFTEKNQEHTLTVQTRMARGQ